MHDFKGGLKNTIAYMSSARAQVVLSNVICDGVKVNSTEKQFCDHEFLTSNKVYPLTETIGVVGFVNQDVMVKFASFFFWSWSWQFFTTCVIHYLETQLSRRATIRRSYSSVAECHRFNCKVYDLHCNRRWKLGDGKRYFGSNP